MLEILQGALLSLLAPAGIWLGWHLQRKDKIDDRRERRRELLRAKAEDIYIEIEGALERSANAQFQALRELHNMAKAELKYNSQDFDRLKALLHMYFPNSNAIVSQHVISVASHSERYNKKVNEIYDDSNLTADDKLKKINENKLEYASQMFTMTVATMGQLRTFMNEQVKDLI